MARLPTRSPAWPLAVALTVCLTAASCGGEDGGAAAAPGPPVPSTDLTPVEQGRAVAFLHGSLRALLAAPLDGLGLEAAARVSPTQAEPVPPPLTPFARACDTSGSVRLGLGASTLTFDACAFSSDEGRSYLVTGDAHLDLGDGVGVTLGIPVQVERDGLVDPFTLGGTATLDPGPGVLHFELTGTYAGGEYRAIGSLELAGEAGVVSGAVVSTGNAATICDLERPGFEPTTTAEADYRRACGFASP